MGLETPPPRYGLGEPPCVGLETTPWRPARHAGIPPARHAGIPPPGDLQGMLGYHLQIMLRYQSPHVNRITDTCKNITLPQLAGGNESGKILGQFRGHVLTCDFVVEVEGKMLLTNKRSLRRILLIADFYVAEFVETLNLRDKINDLV